MPEKQNQQAEDKKSKEGHKPTKENRIRSKLSRKSTTQSQTKLIKTKLTDKTQTRIRLRQELTEQNEHFALSILEWSPIETQDENFITKEKGMSQTKLPTPTQKDDTRQLEVWKETFFNGKDSNPQISYTLVLV